MWQTWQSAQHGGVVEARLDEKGQIARSVSPFNVANIYRIIVDDECAQTVAMCARGRRGTTVPLHTVCSMW